MEKISWRDASGLKDTGQNEWFTLDEALEKSKCLWDEYVISVGWVVVENDNFLIIAATRSVDVYADLTMIPKSLIFKRCSLDEKN